MPCPEKFSLRAYLKRRKITKKDLNTAFEKIVKKK